MNPVATCPNRQELESLVQGRMPFAEVELLAQHLESCNRCARPLTELIPKAWRHLQR